jgi:hypothetical protein
MVTSLPSTEKHCGAASVQKTECQRSIWSSECYFPPAVKAVPIPKKSVGTRLFGVPTVSDRIAQMVVKLVFEPEVEPHFLPDSYLRVLMRDNRQTVSLSVHR